MNDLELVLLHKLGKGGGDTLIKKTITENGTYAASDDEADGYSSVSVDVKNIYIEAEVESGGYIGATQIDGIFAPDNGSQVSIERCRLKQVVFLPAGTYQIDKAPTADSDIQFNIAQHRLGAYSGNYAIITTAVGQWFENLPVTLTLEQDRYISVLLRKVNNVGITPQTAGGHVIIQKV